MRLLTRKSILLAAPLVLMAAFAWLGNVAQTNAQQFPIHVFEGEVFIDGRPAPDGTSVTAFIDGIGISVTTTLGGGFGLAVTQPPGQFFQGKIVELRGRTPDGREFRFPQTAIWQPGGETSMVLELKDFSPSFSDQKEPSHVFEGEVFIDGHPAEDGTLLFVYIDGVRVPGSEAKVVNGRYRIEVAEPPDRSFFGKMVEFKARTVDGRELGFPQTETWFPHKEIFFFLEYFAEPIQPSGPFPGLPIPELPGGLDFGCIIKVLGRIPAGPEDMTNQELVRVAQNCMSGSGPGDDLARLDQERARLEMERALQEEQQRLEEERDRLDRERMERERARQKEQARLDQERLQQDQERIKREREFAEQLRLQEDERERSRMKQERSRMEQQLALERERIDRERELEEERIQRERALDEERARLDQERIQQERRRIDQEFAQREERLRREVELNLELDRQRREQGPRPPGEEGPPSGGDPPHRGPTRGFFTNSQVGQLGSVNNLLEPTTLAVLGILFTLGATTLQLFRGS